MSHQGSCMFTLVLFQLETWGSHVVWTQSVTCVTLTATRPRQPVYVMMPTTTTTASPPAGDSAGQVSTCTKIINLKNNGLVSSDITVHKSNYVKRF